MHGSIISHNNNSDIYIVTVVIPLVVVIMLLGITIDIVDVLEATTITL